MQPAKNEKLRPGANGADASASLELRAHRETFVFLKPRPHVKSNDRGAEVVMMATDTSVTA